MSLRASRSLLRIKCSKALTGLQTQKSSTSPVIE
jgi:hypothetical protein